MGEPPFDQDAPLNMSGADWLQDGDPEPLNVGDARPAAKGDRREDLTVEQIGALWNVRLQNDRQWVDKNGRVHDIPEMDASHRNNVRAYLRRHATRIQWAVDMYALGTMRGVSEDMDLDSIVDEMAEKGAMQFLYETPLYQALVAADL